MFNVYENKSSVGSDEAIWAYYPLGKKRSTGIAVKENTPGAYPRGKPRPPSQKNTESKGDIRNKGQSEVLLTFFFALHLTLGGKSDICGSDHLFLPFTISGPAGLALNCTPPPPFKFLGTPLQPMV